MSKLDRREERDAIYAALVDTLAGMAIYDASHTQLDKHRIINRLHTAVCTAAGIPMNYRQCPHFFDDGRGKCMGKPHRIGNAPDCLYQFCDLGFSLSKDNA